MTTVSSWSCTSQPLSIPRIYPILAPTSFWHSNCNPYARTQSVSSGWLHTYPTCITEAEKKNVLCNASFPSRILCMYDPITKVVHHATRHLPSVYICLHYVCIPGYLAVRICNAPRSPPRNTFASSLQIYTSIQYPSLSTSCHEAIPSRQCTSPLPLPSLMYSLSFPPNCGIATSFLSLEDTCINPGYAGGITLSFVLHFLFWIHSLDSLL